VLDLSLVGFAGRDDADDVVPGRVDHHEQALFDLAHQLVAIFAVAVPGIGLDQTVWVEEGSGSVGEVEPALGKARVALRFILNSSVTPIPKPDKAKSNREAKGILAWPR